MVVQGVGAEIGAGVGAQKLVEVQVTRNVQKNAFKLQESVQMEVIQGQKMPAPVVAGAQEGHLEPEVGVWQSFVGGSDQGEQGH